VPVSGVASADGEQRDVGDDQCREEQSNRERRVQSVGPALPRRSSPFNAQ
jgi:hypothetical protein